MHGIVFFQCEHPVSPFTFWTAADTLLNGSTSNQQSQVNPMDPSLLVVYHFSHMGQSFKRALAEFHLVVNLVNLGLGWIAQKEA